MFRFKAGFPRLRVGLVSLISTAERQRHILVFEGFDAADDFHNFLRDF